MNQNENRTTTAESLSEVSAQLEKIITELLDSHPQKKGSVFVIGCSTSEVTGGSIGKIPARKQEKQFLRQQTGFFLQKEFFLPASAAST